MVYDGRLSVETHNYQGGPRQGNTEFAMSFPGRAVQRTWHLVDAANQTVGRLATTIAPILKGKHKPTFRPNADIGDYVVIVNADKV
jgi:ribosomal protein L13